MTYLPEDRFPNVRAVYYDPHHQKNRTRSLLVHGWHMNGVNRVSPYGLPVLIQEDGSLKAHDPEDKSFMGITYSASTLLNLRKEARCRWERDNAARMKQLAEQKAADATEKAEQERKALEASETAKRLTEGHAEVLGNADETIAGAMDALKEYRNV